MIQYELDRKKTIKEMIRQHSRNPTQDEMKSDDDTIDLPPVNQRAPLQLAPLKPLAGGGGGGGGGPFQLPGMVHDRTQAYKSFASKFMLQLFGNKEFTDEVIIYFLASLPPNVLGQLILDQNLISKRKQSLLMKELESIWRKHYGGSKRQKALRDMSERLKSRRSNSEEAALSESQMAHFNEKYEMALKEHKDPAEMALTEYEFGLRVQELKTRFEYFVKPDKMIQAELESRIKEKNWFQLDNQKIHEAIRSSLEGPTPARKQARRTNNFIVKMIIEFLRPSLSIPFYETPVNAEFGENDGVLVIPAMRHQGPKRVAKIRKIQKKGRKEFFLVEYKDGRKETIDPQRIRKPFDWKCYRCGNKEKALWRDIYKEKNWVTCIRCGLVAEKTQRVQDERSKEKRYVKRHQVRESNFGGIYFGYDSVRDRPVAIKENDLRCMTLKVRKNNGKPVAEDVRAEVKYHKMLCPETNTRPHGILQIYDEYEDAKNLYVILEWADQDELFEYVVGKFRDTHFLENKKKIIQWQHEMQNMFYEICLGTKVLHDKNIVHRDLSLENVLLSKNLNRRQGEPKLFPRICDFGLTTEYRRAHNDSVGKLGYMSPECFAGRYDGKANDVWCLGIMLFMMMIGAPPYGKIGDRAYSYVVDGEEAIRFLLQQYRRYHLVPAAAFEVIVGIFIGEDQRFTIDQILATQYCKEAKKRSFWMT